MVSGVGVKEGDVLEGLQGKGKGKHRCVQQRRLSCPVSWKTRFSQGGSTDKLNSDTSEGPGVSAGTPKGPILLFSASWMEDEKVLECYLYSISLEWSFALVGVL